MQSRCPVASRPKTASRVHTPTRLDHLRRLSDVNEPERRMRALPAQLAADLRAQRPEVIGDLLSQFGRELLGVAFLIVRNHADAEEVVMDTLLTAWRRAADLRNDAALRTWLLRIATRHALSRRRRRQHPMATIEAAASIVASRLDQPSPDRLIVAEALRELPPRCVPRSRCTTTLD